MDENADIIAVYRHSQVKPDKVSDDDPRPEKRPSTNKSRAAYLKMHYGITLEQYGIMSEAQEHSCAICRISGVKLVVDHCHVANVVRKLLCAHCNSMLGFAKDSPEVLERAAAYVREH